MAIRDYWNRIVHSGSSTSSTAAMSSPSSRSSHERPPTTSSSSSSINNILSRTLPWRPRRKGPGSQDEHKSKDSSSAKGKASSGKGRSAVSEEERRRYQEMLDGFTFEFGRSGDARTASLDDSISPCNSRRASYDFDGH